MANEEGEDNGTIYDEGGREDLVESDELSAEEEGFMRGYEAADEPEPEESTEEEKQE